jgi:3',5'-cyclic AMP phosphodiesterase CpdA
MPWKRPLALAALFSLFLAVWPAFPGAASLPQTASHVTFGLFTDLHAHDRDSPLDGKWMTHTEERLTAFTESMNARAIDFIVQLGDFINGWLVLGTDPGDPERIPAILAWADALYGAFDGPRYHVLGNHDLFNLDKAELRSILGLDSTYYSFDAGPFHFVTLDVQYAEDGADLANTFSGVGGFVPDAELAWLRQDLAANRDRPTVVFVHQMLDAFVEEWGRPLVANQPDVQRALEEAGNVIAVLQGHDHDYHHELVGGIHYMTFEALVDQDSPPSWAIITLDPVARTITIDGTGDQPSETLRYGADGDG